MNIMTTKPKPFGVLLRAGWRRAWGPLRPQLIALQLMLMVPLVSMTACEDDVVKQAPPPANKGARPSESKSSKSKNAAATSGPKSARVEGAEGISWVPRRNWERRPSEGRDPFYGFVQEIIAERERQESLEQQENMIEEEVLLPAQRFDVRDFALVAVVTNTAKPKALLIDPEKQPHTVKKGDLIGNRNGVLVDIRRNEIEILQFDSLNASERVVMKLHPELAAGLHIELK